MKHCPVCRRWSIYRPDQLWLPAALWALFAIVTLFTLKQDRALDMVRVYLGTVVPLVGGIMAAYALLDDPALELCFAAPISPCRLLLERLAPIMTIQAVCALTFQGFGLAAGADLGYLGSAVDVQLAWIIPTAFLVGLGCMVALLARQTMAGAALVSLVWLTELLARGWLAHNAGQYVLIFMGSLMPYHPALRINQVTLGALIVGFALIACRLSRQQGRYI